MVVTARRPTLFCVQTSGGNAPRPWPLGSQIDVTWDPTIPSFIRDILSQAMSTCIASIGKTPSGIAYVSVNQVLFQASADVRIILGDGPSECVLGKAGSPSTTAVTAKLGLRSVKKGDFGMVWSNDEIITACLHLWLHVFGVPHSRSPNTKKYNPEMITKTITKPEGSTRFPASQFDFNGCYDFPTGTANVMRTEPTLEYLAKGSDIPQPTLPVTFIDNHTTAVIRQMYVAPPQVHTTWTYGRGMKGFAEFSTSTKTFTQWISTGDKQSSGPIAAFTYIDLGRRGDFHADAYINNINPSGGYTLNLHSSTFIHDLTVHTMSFLPTDQRVRTGFTTTAGTTFGGTLGGTCEKLVTFSPAFEVVDGKKPDIAVQMFINQFRSGERTWVRIEVEADQISETGFRANLKSWADSRTLLIGVSWIAYRKDDPTIRGGRVTAEHPDWGNYSNPLMDTHTDCRFSTPMLYRPDKIFFGLSHLNVRGDVNLRASMNILSWTNTGMSLKVGTWDKESNYHSMKGDYVAFL